VYDVVLADPPWQYRDWAAPAGETHDRQTGAAKHYPTMKTEDICKILADVGENAALFMWATWPLIKEALAVIEAWGFEYKTVGFVWIKANKGGLGHFFGMGHYTRSNTEICLLGIRGKMPVEDKTMSQLVYEPVMEHSRKPNIHWRIERLYPGRRYLEMFARRRVDGWDCWGNEVTS